MLRKKMPFSLNWVLLYLKALSSQKIQHLTVPVSILNTLFSKVEKPISKNRPCSPHPNSNPEIP
jgi:hypothetical protein